MKKYICVVLVVLSVFMKESKFKPGLINTLIRSCKIHCSRFLIATTFSLKGLAIWCYRCTSATPGCADNFNWRGIGFLGEQCPEKNDICVKITEKRGGKSVFI